LPLVQRQKKACIARAGIAANVIVADLSTTAIHGCTFIRICENSGIRSGSILGFYANNHQLIDTNNEK
jgi:hypothetical protein